MTGYTIELLPLAVENFNLILEVPQIVLLLNDSLRNGFTLCEEQIVAVKTDRILFN